MARPKTQHVAFLVVAAVLTVIWVFKVVIFPRPYWIAVTDLDMPFFMNGLMLKAGFQLENAAHPATPIYSLSALLATVLQTPLGDAQRFLDWAYRIVLIVSLVTVYIFARHMAQQVPGRPLKIAVTLVPYANAAAILYLGYWGSESFLVPIGILVWWGFWQACLGPTPLAMRAVFWSGALGGMACAIKTVYVPTVMAIAIGYVVMILRAERVPERLKLSVRFLAVWFVVLMGYLGLLLTTEFWRRHTGIAWILWVVFGVSLAMWTALIACRTTPLFRQGRGARISGVVRVLGEYFLGALAAWLVGTWPIFKWYGWVLQGMYDGAMASAWDPQLRTGLVEWLRQFVLLAQGVPGWSLLTILTLAIVAMELVGRWRGETSRRQPGELGFGVALAISVLLGLILGLKNRAFTHAVYSGLGVELRFFQPVAVAVAFGLVWATRHWVLDRLRIKAVVAVIVLLTGWAVLEGAVRDIRAQHLLIQTCVARKGYIDERVANVERELGRPPVLLVFGSEMFWPSAAYRQGDLYNSFRFRKAIDQLFINEGEIKVPWRAFYPPDGKPFDLIILREVDLGPEDLDWLAVLGKVERWPEAPGGPLLVVMKALPS